MSNNKEIKLEFAVNEPSLRKAQNAIQSITRDISQLVETARRAGAAMGNITGAGGGGFVGVTGKQGALNTSAESQKLGPIGGNLASGIQSSANLVKGIAAGAKDAYKTLSDGMKDSVSKQVNEIERLRRSIRDLDKDYASLSSGQRSGMRFSLENQMDSAARSMNQGGGGSHVAEGWAGEGYSRPIRRSGGRALIDQANGPGATTNWNDPSALGGTAGASGGSNSTNAVKSLLTDKSFLSQLVKGAALTGAVAAGLNAVGQYAGENIHQSFDPFRRKEMIGATFGNAAMAMRGGDVKSAFALANISKSKEFSEAFGAGSAEDYTNQKIFNAGNGFSGLAGVIAGRGDLDRSLKDAPLQARVALMQKMQMEINSDPVKYQYYDQFGAQAGGRINAMRALGMGQRDEWTKNGTGFSQKTGVRNTAADLLARYQAQGIDEGQVAAAQGSLEPLIGFHAAQRNRDTVVRSNIGHFRGAEALIAAGMQGGGHATNLLRAVSAMGGDPGIASRLGSTVAGGMMDGGAMSGGMGYLGALGAFGGGAMDPMRIQNQLAAGQGATNSLLQGRTDGYQSGRNLLGAINAMPGGSLFGQEFMAGKMSFRQIADIMGGGAVPDALKARGITSGGVGAYANSVSRSIFDRFASNGDNSEQSNFARSVLANGGDAQGFVNGQLKGLKGKQLAAGKDKYATLLGSLLTDEGLAGNDEEGSGMARSLLGLGSVATKKKGFGDAAHGSKEMAVAEGQAAVQRDFNDWLAKTGPELETVYKHLVPLSNQFRDMGTSMTMGVNQTIEALGLLAAAAGGAAEAMDKSGNIHARRIQQMARFDDASWAKARGTVSESMAKEVDAARAGIKKHTGPNRVPVDTYGANDQGGSSNYGTQPRHH